MKRFLPLFFVAFLTTLVGCAANQPAPTPQQTAQDIRIGADIATTTVLLSASDVDRPKFGAYAYETAQVIDTTVGQQKLDVASLNALINKLIANSDSKEKLYVNELFQALALIVNRANGNVPAPTTQASESNTALFIQAAAQGVEDATIMFKPADKGKQLKVSLR